MFCYLKSLWSTGICKIRLYFSGTVCTLKMLIWLWIRTSPLLLTACLCYSSPVSAVTSSEWHPLWAHLALTTTSVMLPPCFLDRCPSLRSSHCPDVLTVGTCRSIYPKCPVWKPIYCLHHRVHESARPSQSPDRTPAQCHTCDLHIAWMWGLRTKARVDTNRDSGDFGRWAQDLQFGCSNGVHSSATPRIL